MKKKEKVQPTNEQNHNTDQNVLNSDKGKDKQSSQKSDHNNSGKVHGMETRSSSQYLVNFLVLISPEFDIDQNNCEIGIFSNYNEWTKKEMQKLKIIMYI